MSVQPERNHSDVQPDSQVIISSKAINIMIETVVSAAFEIHTVDTMTELLSYWQHATRK